MLGIGEDLGGRAVLDLTPPTQHRDRVGDLTHDGEVVGDEHVGEAQVALQPGEQPQDLRLHGDVQRRDGLVEHDQLGFDDQGARDGDTLTLPAGKLPRMPRRDLGRESDQLEVMGHPLGPLAAAADAEVAQRLGEDVADALTRIE